LQNAENDLVELKVRRLKRAKNREKWAPIVRENKVLRGQYRKGLSNYSKLVAIFMK
jgi:hypothetical protein